MSSIFSLFEDSAAAFPGRPALAVAGGELSYKELYLKAAGLAEAIACRTEAGRERLTAVFAYRSVTAYAGILGALMLGHGYVPLNCTFPPDRTRTMLERSGCGVLIADARSEAQLDRVLDGLERELLIVLPERQDVRRLGASWPGHRFIGAGELREAETGAAGRRATGARPDSPAYVLFTSGSTGVPKGVVVTHGNVRHYVDFIARRFSISHEDRFSQMFDMTFDLSVADMFVAWSRGACVCCPPDTALINPGRFIRDSGVTIWFSVPSVPIFMKKLGTLKPASYPGVRVSMFCGEALPAEVARAWSAAAPNSAVENLYGPTELTIACMYYRWDAAASEGECEMGLVPIGVPFPGMVCAVVDEALREVGPGETGELLMTGPQVSGGYWKDSERTSAAFIKLPGRPEVFYRTGDRVRKPAGSGPMTYIGRTDNQLKVLGHRVELGEIEAAVRRESGIDGVVAVGWPVTSGGAGGVEVFLQAGGEGFQAPDLKEKVASRLPGYMVPRRFHFLARIPLNSNGKFDRKALIKHLEGGVV